MNTSETFIVSYLAILLSSCQAVTLQSGPASQFRAKFSSLAELTPDDQNRSEGRTPCPNNPRRAHVLRTRKNPVTNAHSTRNTEWPNQSRPATPPTTAILVVNYNTRQLVSHLIWSIFNVLGHDGFGEIVVIDNASTDGSLLLLRALADANLISLVENSENFYHGPAINQGFDWLAERAIHESLTSPSAVWILDSDCVIVRNDALVDATQLMSTARAALVGQPVKDKWSDGSTFGLHSLLVDPAQVWRREVQPFEEHGQPSEALQQSCISANLKMVSFNFTKDDYVIHIGRGTLASVANRGDSGNTYFDWAIDGHSEPHFAEEANAAANYERFVNEFESAVPALSPEELVNAISALRHNNK